MKTYMSKETGERESSVSSKGEHLTRCGRYIRDAATNGQNNKDTCHERGSNIGLSRNKKGLDEWHNVWVREYSCHISETETERDEHYETHRAVNDNSPHHRTRQCEGSVSDFFGHLKKSVLFAA